MNTLVFTDIPGKYPYLCALLCAGALLASCLEDSSTSRPFLVAITSVLTICSVLMAEVHRRGYTDHLVVLSQLRIEKRPIPCKITFSPDDLQEFEVQILKYEGLPGDRWPSGANIQNKTTSPDHVTYCVTAVGSRYDVAREVANYVKTERSVRYPSVKSLLKLTELIKSELPGYNAELSDAADQVFVNGAEIPVQSWSTLTLLAYGQTFYEWKSNGAFQFTDETKIKHKIEQLKIDTADAQQLVKHAQDLLNGKKYWCELDNSTRSSLFNLFELVLNAYDDDFGGHELNGRSDIAEVALDSYFQTPLRL